MTLTAGQQQGFDLGVSLFEEGEGDVGVIAGYAGVGKTYLLKHLLDHFKRSADVKLAAPTGKAALRMTEMTGHEASTLHSLLYQPVIDEEAQQVFYKKRNWSGENAQPPPKLVIVDESSMVGDDVFQTVEDLRLMGTNILFVGDPFQLKPVQSSFSVFEHFKGRRSCRGYVEMTEIKRQALDNPIIAASLALRQGDASLSGLPFFRAVNDDAGRALLDVQRSGGFVITHTNKLRIQLNNALRGWNGRTGGVQEGEPLMCLKNNYPVGLFNGELFTFTGWRRDPSHAIAEDRIDGRIHDVSVGVSTVNDIEATLITEEIDGSCTANPLALTSAAKRWAGSRGYKMEIEDPFSGDSTEVVIPHVNATYGYAVTCHKSQGSQADRVFVALERTVRQGTEDGLRWLYTAITRAAKEVIICRWQ